AHIPDKAKLIQECARVLKGTGTIAFTDILQIGPLSKSEQERLEQEMTFPYLETFEGYTQLLEKYSFTLLEKEDLSPLWIHLLRQRLEMYRSLKDEAIKKFGEAHYQRWDSTYSFFVSLLGEGKLGGGRFVGKKNG
ncbi:MAG: hypothetical protein L0Y56_19550, partial [Nitrospira sp.]|nr:hypothetical protein [Nitrospira sp.]